MVSRARFNEGTREVSFRYDILDKNNVKKGEASNIAEGKVSFNAFSSIHRTATFKLREEAPPPENINLTAGNTYTTLNFPVSGWSTDDWIGTNTGQLLPQTRAWNYNGMNSEFVGEIKTVTQGTIWQDWNVYKPSSLTTATWTAGTGNGAYGNTMTINKPATTYHQAGIVSDMRIIVPAPRYVNFCFCYKLEVGGAVSSSKPFVWYLPDSANEGNNWTGNLKIPDNQLTTKSLGSGWYFCEGYYELGTGSTSGWLWTIAAGFEGSESFKIQIGNFYVFDSGVVSKRFNNSGSTTSQVFDISYNKVVDGFNPTFQKARLYFDTIYARYNPSQVNRPKNDLYYQTSTDGGTTWSPFTLAVNGANITTISGSPSSTNLKMRLKWEFDRVSMRDTTPRFVDLRIDVNYNAKGKNPLTDSIDYRVDRIRPYMIYKDGTSTVERSLGIFLLNSPKRKDKGSRVYREIEAYDQLSILADAKVIHAFQTTPNGGKKVTELITEILTGTDSTIPVKFGYSFPAAFVNISNSTNVYLDRTLNFNVGDTWLNVINAMLMFINYTPIYVDGNGVLRAEPYKAPADRPTSHTYIDDELSIIYKEAEEEFDIHDVPNVFVVTQQADSEGERMYSRIFNTNEGSLSSTVNVGRYIVDYREVDQVANQGILDTYCARIANEASQAYGKVVFRTALMPSHEYMNNIQLRYQNLRVDDIYTETDWSMDLKIGGQMEHRVRKVVRI
ncbi:hypothetical protein CN926_00860 [Bacillus thuringiensis]|uniref:hypothetical protein n=1 Tax=Bacillus thuringiensis TaxID=1428 RepID=UPI000BFB2A8E|nr:hypothetical protein [Bacillus thuringiensis]PGL88585.1 hypothetical protein CN926_00860 [Bacillus thuringiensis]